MFAGWPVCPQRGVLLHAEGQQSSPKSVVAELLRLGDRQGAAARDRPELAPAEGGHGRLCVAHPSLPGRGVLELRAPAAPRPGPLRVGGQPVPAQPGRPLRGAAVHRPHRLSPSQRRRHLLPGQEVLEFEVSIAGGQCQHHRRVGGGGGEELQKLGAAGPDRVPAGQEPVHQVRRISDWAFAPSRPTMRMRTHSCDPLHAVLAGHLQSTARSCSP